MLEWAKNHAKKHHKDKIIFGVEPTGHYWKNLAYYLKAQDYKIVVVNPMHVKKSKEFDDNSPTKNDVKDAKVIAQLIKDGRYSVPNLLDGRFAELREGVKVRDQLKDQMMITEGRIQNILDRYFPEFFDVFKKWDGKTAIVTLKSFPFPSQIVTKQPEEILQKWKVYIKSGVGIKRAQALVEAAHHSVGVAIGLSFAKQELAMLIEQYELYQKQLEGIEAQLEELVMEIPGAEEMVAVKGLGIFTVATVLSEIGDLNQYCHAQQTIKLAGLSLRENSSGKYKGKTKITKRGRSKLRKALYLATNPLIAHNETFKTLHQYYTKRPVNPLKGPQSKVALCCKLLKALFVMGQRQCAFDGEKLIQGIPQETLLKVA